MVSNTAGSVTSAPARVRVSAAPPLVTTAPHSRAVADGSQVTLAVAATGTQPLAYRWHVDGAPIEGATAATHTFTASFAESGRRYSVSVSNAAGTATTEAAVVTVVAGAPMVTIASQAVSVDIGGTAMFGVTVTGTPPFTYRWQRSDDNGASWVDLSGATSASLSLADVTLADANARFRASVTNAQAGVLSEAATLSVRPNLRILAGAAGGGGYAEGSGMSARLYFPRAVVVDTAGNLLVADSFNHLIRRVTPQGQTSIFAGRAPGPVLFGSPNALATDASGNVYVGSDLTISRIAPDGSVSLLAGGQVGSEDGTGAAARFKNIAGMASDADGNLVVSDAGNFNVRRISRTGVVTTLAGAAGQHDYVDGQGSSARFLQPGGVALDAAGNVYVTDFASIRKITADGTVSRFAGHPDRPGNVDGPRLSARFASPSGLAFDAGGSLYAGGQEHIRRIGIDGIVTTVAGGGSDGNERDGTAAAARVANVSSIAVMAPDKFAFAEPATHTVRTLTRTLAR